MYAYCIGNTLQKVYNITILRRQNKCVNTVCISFQQFEGGQRLRETISCCVSLTIEFVASIMESDGSHAL